VGLNFIDLFLIAIALSMDAFSVSMSCGIKLKKNNYPKFIKISLAFGTFQAIMPLIGYYFSNTFLKNFLDSYTSILTFSVFFLLGLKTSYDYFSKENTEQIKYCTCEGYKCLTTLAIATSIDAFLIGSVLGLAHTKLVFPLILIGIVTIMNSYLGCLLGNKAISRLKQKSTLVAALILFLLAFKSLF